MSVGHCGTDPLGTAGASGGVYIVSRSFVDLVLVVGHVTVDHYYNGGVQYGVSIMPKGRVEDTKARYRGEARLCSGTVVVSVI